MHRYQVDVPIHHATDQQRRGLHVFTGYAFVPAYSISCLFRALSGGLDDDEDIVCTVHGPNTDEDQDDDPEGRADLEEQFAAAVRE
ncbi:hypothetical protein ACIP6P_30560 [Streptomyces sp. NPDC088729]|uniref:hypothetical protein n=1 Tax=Streptomyces sp. NPDC088729 TaxID=3365876 RepID=UPI00382F70B5